MFGKYISFKTQKRNKAKNEFEKNFYNLLNNSFLKKILENVRIRLKLEFNKNCNDDRTIKQQSY